MQPLPRDFLTQIAREYRLSREQEEAFVERFSRNKEEHYLAESLNISQSAFRTRMSGVYKKFSIGGFGPGKFRRLHDLLLKKYDIYLKKTRKKSSNISLQDSSVDIDIIVEQVRAKIKAYIQKVCGTMQVLDMTQAIDLGNIYTDVNILEKITARQRRTLTELQQAFKNNPENLERLGLGCVAEERVPGLEAVLNYRMIMIWGKPGAGKTTFLKYLAMHCIKGQFLAKRVPIFVTLKDFAESSHKHDLHTFIKQYLAKCGVTETEKNEVLGHGRALILLDGLDEVKEEDSKLVINEIQRFANQYRTHYFVITCRIAAKEYTFQGFTEVELADFDDQQIESFADKWFSKDTVKTDRFTTKLEENKPIKELATNPLLLTLLCLVFGEVGNFPYNRGELYEEGVDLLLKKWDAKRNIERDLVYQKLSIKRKESLLSNIAFSTFNKKDYFFKKRTVENYIADYISNLPDAKTDPEALLVDSNKVLRSIQAQHGLLVERAKGIYSFSHLTFQEYFTARKIADSRGIKYLRDLACNITDRRWREVFLLVAGIMEDASDLLVFMKQEVDNLVAEEEKIQKFLLWLSRLSNVTVVRFFYITLAINKELRHNLEQYLALERGLVFNQEKVQILSLQLDRFIDEAGHPELRDLVLSIKTNLAERNDKKKFRRWQESHEQIWIKELHQVLINYPHFYNYQSSSNYEKILQQYYDANQLLIECLSSDAYISIEVRKEVEDTLFLPMAEIEKRNPSYSNFSL